MLLFIGPLCAIAVQGVFGARAAGFEAVAYLCVALLVAGVMAGYLQINISRKSWTQILFVVTFGLLIQAVLGLFHWTMLDFPLVHAGLPQKFATAHGGFFQRNHFASFTAAITLWLGWALSGAAHAPPQPDVFGCGIGFLGPSTYFWPARKWAFWGWRVALF